MPSHTVLPAPQCAPRQEIAPPPSSVNVAPPLCERPVAVRRIAAGRPCSPKPVAPCETSETVAQPSFVFPTAIVTPPRSTVRPFGKPVKSFVFAVSTVQ